jgi:LysR family transcriptional regulator for metE and metH
MDKYRSNWPEVELDITGGFNFAPIPALVRGDLDLVITSDPIALPGIHYVPLFRYEAMLAVNPQHRLAQRTVVEPSDLKDEILIMYPVERDRLDIFTRFLDPADVEPKDVRTAELTAMVVQLVASGRGVASLPNWSLAEYEPLNTVVAKSLGEHGLWATLYAAVREDQVDSPYMEDFLGTANDTCFDTLQGIKRVSE